MLFSSPRFFAFVAALLVLLALPFGLRAKKRILGFASCLFYAAWDYRYLGLLLAISVIDFVCADRIARSTAPRGKKAWLALSVVSNIGILAYFKYTNFFLANLSELTGTPARTMQILLPTGISFYTFKSMSYTIDVYRGHIEPCRSIIDYATFVTFFADLIAGPIVRASVFLPQMDRPIGPTRARWRQGGSLFLFGLSKKLLIADRASVIADAVFAHPEAYSATAVWCGVIAYAIQIYADFSGYSDMAIGTAKVIGYDLPENFNMPYLSANVTEFWRRWHITLSSWLRDYLYIPLGGNKRGPGRTYVNLAVTMLLGGLWHGASWNFIIWGGLHGTALGVHRAVSRRPRARPLPIWIAQPMTLAFVLACWIPFRAPTLAATRTILSRMTGLEGGGARWFPTWLPWLVLATIAAHALGRALERSTNTGRVGEWLGIRLHIDPVCGRYVSVSVESVQATFVVASWILLLFYFAATTASPFIYFQF